MTSEEFRDYLDWLATPEARTSKVRWTPELGKPRQPLTLAGLREYLVDLEERWLPTVGAQVPPKLTLIRGGRDA